MNNSILDQINANTSQYGAPMGMPQTVPTQQPQGSILDKLQNQPTQPSAPAPAPQETGNWFTHLLPTITSIGGSLLGTLADPFTAGLGTIGGGAAGSALGKTIENMLEGKSNAGEGVAGSALEGAIGGGIGKVGEGLIGGAGKAIANVGEKGLAKEAATKSAQAAIDEAQATRNVFGGVPTAITQGRYANQSLQGAQDLAKTVGINHNSPQEMVDAANNALTPLVDFRNKIVHAGGPINTAGIVDQAGNKVAPSVNDLIESSLSNTHPLTGESLGQDLRTVLGSTDKVAAARGRMVSPNTTSSQLIDQAQSILGKSMSSATDPQELLNASTKIGNIAHSASVQAAKTGAADINGVNEAKAQFWNNLDQGINKLLYGRPSVDNAVASEVGKFTAENVGGNQALADYLNGRLANATSGGDLNSVLSEFMNLKNQGNAALDVLGNPSSAAALNTAKQALKGESTVQGDGTANILQTSGHPVANLMGKALKIGSSGGKGGQAAVNLGSTLERIAQVGGLGVGGVLGNLPNDVSGGANASTVVGAATPVNNFGTNNLEGDIMNSNSPNTLALRQMLGLQQFGGGYNVPTEMQLYSAPAAQELTNLTQANAAQKQLNDYINLLNQAGGAQGGIGGLLTLLGSKITGGPASQLEAERQQIAQSLSKLTGGPVNLPGITSNQEAANSVLSQLQSQIGSYL